MASLSKRINRGLYVGRIVMVFTLLCAAALQPAFGQSFTVKDLGTLPGGIVSVASGINDRGQVVGDAATALFFQPHAFLFEDGAMVDLGTLHLALPGADFSIALGINNRGQVVGFSGTGIRSEAVLFENGVIIKLPPLPGAPHNNNQATGINNSGQVVGLATTASGEQHAFLFDHGVIASLKVPPGRVPRSNGGHQTDQRTRSEAIGRPSP
jgi:probable HAF family extracellular repeat protein